MNPLNPKGLKPYVNHLNVTIFQTLELVLDAVRAHKPNLSGTTVSFDMTRPRLKGNAAENSKTT
jgi:hypothetical protein